MRLWHYKLIPFLPDSQLKAQWRELNSIFKKQNRHILINYVYTYPQEDLLAYTYAIIFEMLERNIKINSKENARQYFGYDVIQKYINKYVYLKEECGFNHPIITVNYLRPFFKHHNNRYLLQCFYNLQEKYDRGQTDFSKEKYDALLAFMCEHFKNSNVMDVFEGV